MQKKRENRDSWIQKGWRGSAFRKILFFFFFLKGWILLNSEKTATSLKCQLCQVFFDLLPVLVTNQAGSSNKFVKNNQQICQDIARIESCWELTQPCCLKPLKLQFLSLTESSRKQLHRHLTRVARWWWHWWHVTASGAEPLLGLSYLPLACWEPPSLPHPAKQGSQWTLLKKCTTSYLWWDYTYSAGKYRKLVFDHIWISCMDGG